MRRADGTGDGQGRATGAEAAAAHGQAAALLAATVDEAAVEVGATRAPVSSEPASAPEADGPEALIGFLRDETLFAVAASGRLEVRLPADIADAALRTPDTTPSPRGVGWISIAPRTGESHVADRARAWFVTAWRHAGPRGR